MGANDSVHDEFFAKSDADKQRRYEERVCNEIIRHLGEPAAQAAHYRKVARSSASAVDGYTPEWLSDHRGWPIVFRAVRDFMLEKRDFPGPGWLFDNRIDGTRCAGMWEKLWLETLDRFSHARHVCVCFRPRWAKYTLALHNFSPALLHQSPGGAMVWMTKRTQVILQSLPHVVQAARGELVIRPGPTQSFD